MSGERSRSIERIQKSGIPQVEVLSKLACVAGGMACAKIGSLRNYDGNGNGNATKQRFNELNNGCARAF